jgi:hypothetical protein
MTDREDKEAAALRVALEKGVREDELPEDALEAAELIRYGQSGGELDPAAERRILGDLLRTEKVKRGRVWWVPAGAILATAASIALVALMRQFESTEPRPPIALLRAQAGAAAGEPAAPDELERQMREYRRSLFAGWMKQ